MGREPDVRLSDLELVLEPAIGNLPFAPVVSSLNVKLSNDALEKGAKVGIDLGRNRAPVDVEFRSARFIVEGAEIVVQVSKGRFFKTDVRALIAISASNAQQVRVEIREVKALGKLPIDAFIEPILDKVLSKAAARPGVSRAIDGKRALFIQPDMILAGYGLPMRFADGGSWTVETKEGSLGAGFQSS